MCLKVISKHNHQPYKLIKDINDRVAKKESNPSTNLIDVVPGMVEQFRFSDGAHWQGVDVECKISYISNQLCT